MKKIILLFILLLLPALVLAEEAVRTWTTSAGKEIVGVWEMEKDTEEEKIHIRSNGKLYRVNVEKLSEADQAHIAEKRAASRSIDDDAFEEVVEEPEAGEKAIVVADREGLREEAHRYALLIGVNEYNKPISSLKFCMNDMKYLAETFEAIGFQRENITLMTDESASNLRPTKNNILNQVEMLCEMMSPEDLLIIAFSGHGVMVDGKAYLCPGDANAENADSLVSRDWVYSQLENSQAAQKLMIVDACRNEITIAGSKSFGNARTLEDPTGAQGKGFVLLASCRPKQVSWEMPELKHGVFTHFLAEGLRGGAKNDEGYVSILALADYASQKTKTYVHRNLNTLQIPMVQMPDEMTNFLLAKIDRPPLPTLDELKKQLDGKFEYKISEGSVTITKYTGSAASVEIPYGVVAIGEETFKDCKSLTSVTIPNSVTSIGNSAFSDCGSLTSVTIPDSVTSIGNSAFSGCGSLTAMTIPNSVTSIGNSAFCACGLTSVTIPDSVTSIGNSAFSGCGSLTAMTIPNSVTSIGEGAFSNCRSLTSVTIPNSVTSIGNSAFWSCDSLTSVTIPKSVTSIGDRAFSSCYGLTAVTIPESVTSIGDRAFNYCESLTSVTIPESVTSIGKDAFDYCRRLTIYGTEGSASQTYAKSNEILFSTDPSPYCDAAGVCYSHDGKTLLGAPRSLSGEYTIPDSVTSIGNEAFQYCRSLTSVTIPDSVTSIGDSAFSGCGSLKSVTIPNSVTSIGNSAFYECESLTSVTIPDSVTSIGDSAFSGCGSLKSVTIPNSVTSIGNYAFYECESLTSVTIPNSVTSIGDSAFWGCSWLTSVTIPDSVTSIGDRAFRGCESLTSVTIPDSVTSIGNYAFYWCKRLTSVTIPDSVTSIGDYAFGGCGKLTEILVSAGNTHFKSVDGVLFTADGKTLIQVPAAKGLTEYTIPDGVTSIGGDAFYYCRSLTSVTIPNSVTSIGNSAFCFCDSLMSVTIPNSVTSIGDEAFEYCDSLTSVTVPNSVTSIGKDAFGDFPPKDLVIYGKAGSAAERYAKENGTKFQVKW